jgi:hypothetical protein
MLGTMAGTTVLCTQYPARVTNSPKEWGSSSSVVEPTWGRTTPRNDEENLRMWEETSTRIQDIVTRVSTCKAGDETMTDHDAYTSPNCMTFNVLDDTTDQQESGNLNAREERDDEVEFTRIPIAGEDSEDYVSDDESDSNHDETTTVFTQNMSQNIMKTEEVSTG